ncbi:hypothetical protein JCM10908_005515 [Rhodotorula pacifica]|uniref:alpha/beta hydrolase n=1 Tax=Rhodotorula pacifica TaxID=1495444 RepID=UPI003172B896
MSPSAADPIEELHPKADRKTKLVVGATTLRVAVPAAIQHWIRGPPAPTWGVTLSITTRVGREMILSAGHKFSQKPPETHDDLIRQIRKTRFVDPLSAVKRNKTRGGTVWKHDLVVPRRPQEGVLKEVAEKETGKRILRGEWVIAEWLLDPTGPPPRPQVILHLHGGAHVLQDLRGYREYNAMVSMMTRCRVYCIDYRLAPEAVFPESLLDAITAYFYLTEDLGVAPSDIILSGDSAGGGIAVQLAMFLRDQGYPQVGGMLLLSPWLDLTTSFESWHENRNRDFLTIDSSTEPLHPPRLYVSPVWPPTEDSMREFNEQVVHPYISPALAPLSALRDLPPTLIHTGGFERLRDEQTVFMRRARLASPSNEITHQLWVDGVHVFASMQATIAGASSQEQVGIWLERLCERRPSESGTDALWAKSIDDAVCAEREARLRRTGKIKPFQKPTKKWRYQAQVERMADIRVKPTGFAQAREAADEANSVPDALGLTEVFRPRKATREERREKAKELRKMQNNSAEP